MGHTRKTDTFLVDGQLVVSPIERPTGTGRWRKNKQHHQDLRIATVTGKVGSIKVKRGSRATDDLVSQSILHHVNIDPERLDSSLWREIPDSLRITLEDTIRNKVEKVTDRWSRYSHETTILGSMLEGLDSHNYDGWKMKLDFVEFSSQSKESDTGTDVAILYDVESSDDRRAIKTLWLQAKRSSRLPEDWQKLPRLRGQMNNMKKFTDSSYGMVFTESGVHVVGTDINTSMSLDKLMGDTIKCTYGDSSMSVFAESLSRRHHIFRVQFVEQ